MLYFFHFQVSDQFLGNFKLLEADDGTELHELKPVWFLYSEDYISPNGQYQFLLRFACTGSARPCACPSQSYFLLE